jgi:diguanylate cyclase (GGDEF) domain
VSQSTIGIYSVDSGLAEHLRSACPGLTFLDSGVERESSRVAVIDPGDDLVSFIHPTQSVVRVVLATNSERSSRRQGELWTDRDAFLQSPGDFLSIAIDLSETIGQASRLENEVAYLNQIHDLMTMADASEVSERITLTVLELLGLEKGTLFLHDPRLERYMVSFTNDGVSDQSGEFLPGVDPELLQRALASGRSFAADASMGMIIMPMQVEHDLVGVLRVPIGRGVRIGEEVIGRVSQYLGAVSSVLGNIYQLSRSRDLAMRDDLTKAYNRRFFEAYLDEEIERARRYGSVFSIIFLDLDDLKTVNNYYGHLSGSRTLQEVAKRILAAVRGIDKVVRFGGDEFCIILPHTDQEQAVAVANRVRKSLIASTFHLGEAIDISVSASFGIATYPVHGITKDDLIRQADAAMYRVKSTTKNAVGIATVQDARVSPL